MSEERCTYCCDPTLNEALFNDRRWSKNNDGVFTGLEVYIYTTELYMNVVLDEQYIKPLSKSESIPINFCPMCGRRLKDEN